MGAYRATWHDLADTKARTAYTTLYDSSPQRTVFAHLGFADALCESLGYGARLLLISRKGGPEVGAGAVLFERPFGPLRRVVVPPLTPYTGPLFVRPLREADLARPAHPLPTFIDAVQRRYASAAFHLPPTVDARAFLWAGFDATPRYTHWGTPGAQPRAAASRNVRRTLDAAADWTVKEEATAALIAAYAVGALPPRFQTTLPETRVRSLMEGLHERGLARLLTTQDDTGRVRGGVAVLSDGRTHHYWSGGSVSGPAMTLLTMDAVEEASRHGHALDLAGANLAPVAEFKRRFGLPLRVHARVSWSRSRLLRTMSSLRG